MKLFLTIFLLSLICLKLVICVLPLPPGTKPADSEHPPMAVTANPAQFAYTQTVDYSQPQIVH